MKINSAKFIKSAVMPKDFPELDLPEIAFVGRSNVGKSSLINKLLNRKSLAKTSSTPGKTRLINYFLINEELVFVDLPGYGYAKVSKKERESWGVMVDRYLSKSANLKGVVLLQDMRRERSELDRVMMNMIRHYALPVILVLTKADKFSRNRQIERLKKISKSLAVEGIKAIPFSSVSGDGRDELWHVIAEVTAQAMGNGGGDEV
ncbi:MAG: ribosome biogenesis GTP-binding protein YihA/YsxC [Deltaproteobacteria bacterium]|nr:ribosome biogenesis GTP-binding protein YihA/YsxC [Deltaproteobacteria bacterium]